MPEKLDAIVGMTEALLAGGISASDIKAIKGQASPAGRTGTVAVLPLFGTIFPRGGMFEEMSGGTSAEQFGRAFTALVNDPSVDAIVLDVDSPGGQTAGVPEVAETIYKARGRKPIAAVANHLMASAAYFIGSAADELVATPSASVGSIGVVLTHVDESAALEADGLRVTYVHAGKHKVLGNSAEPLNDESLAKLQELVDGHYDMFVKAVAKHRNVKASEVRGGYGEGFVLHADEAKAAGMIDRVATLDETIARLSRSTGRTGRAIAALAELEL